MRVADRVCAALRDPREQGLGSERPVDGRLRIEAESGYAAHVLKIASGSDFRLTSTQFLSVDRTTRRT
jgi:hypothetical protein